MNMKHCLPRVRDSRLQLDRTVLHYAELCHLQDSTAQTISSIITTSIFLPSVTE